MAKLVSNLATILNEKDMTINKLATELGHDRRMIAALVNSTDLNENRIPGNLIADICDYFKIGMHQLFSVVSDESVIDEIIFDADLFESVWFVLDGYTAQLYKHDLKQNKFEIPYKWIVTYLDHGNIFSSKSLDDVKEWLVKNFDIKKIKLLNRKPYESKEVFRTIKRQIFKYERSVFTIGKDIFKYEIRRIVELEYLMGDFEEGLNWVLVEINTSTNERTVIKTTQTIEEMIYDLEKDYYEQDIELEKVERGSLWNA